jgi:hypothetical protein
VLLCLCLFTSSCGESREANKQDSPLSKKLRRAESVSVELNTDEPKAASRPLDQETIAALADAFADAIDDPHPVLWEITGELHVVIDGKPATWLLGLHSSPEGTVGVTGSEYYRGIDSARALSVLRRVPE